MSCPTICCSSAPAVEEVTAAAPVEESIEVQETPEEQEKKEEERELARAATEFDLTSWEFYLTEASEGSEKTSRAGSSFAKNRSAMSMHSLSKSRSGQSFRGGREVSFRVPQAKDSLGSGSGSEFDYGIEIVPEMVDVGPPPAPAVPEDVPNENGKADAEEEKKEEEDEEEKKKVKVDFGEIPTILQGILDFHLIGTLLYYQSLPSAYSKPLICDNYKKASSSWIRREMTSN